MFLPYRRHRILAIDDEPANLMVLGRVLSSEFDLQIATSGDEGLDIAFRTLPDLILLDVLMPRVDGFEVCRRLKIDARTCDVPIVFVTAMTGSEDEVAGLELGAADYLTKPINITIAHQRIRNLIEQVQGRRELARLNEVLGRQNEELRCAQAALEISRDRYADLFELAPAAYLSLAEDGSIVDANQVATDQLGVERSILVGQHLDTYITEADRPSWVELRSTAFRQHGRHTIDLTMTDHSGAKRFMVCDCQTIRHESGASRLLLAMTDLTERRRAEDQMRIAARVFNQAGEAIVVTGPDNIIQTVNTSFSRISGYSAQEAIGQPTSLLKSGCHSAEFYQEMWQSLGSKGFWQGEILNRRKNGEVFPEWLTINHIVDERGSTAHYVAVFSDITQIKESQRKVEFLATHDALTSLPNRTLFYDRLQQAIAQSLRNATRVALLFIDLDHFKEINDSFGHSIGDALLIEAATRLRNAVRDVDTVARLGGDEFTAILANCTAEDAMQIAQRMLDDLVMPFALDGHVLKISASIGIAFASPEDSLIDELICRADDAMYRAKAGGRNRIIVQVDEIAETFNLGE